MSNGGSEKTVFYRARELDRMGYTPHLFSAGPYKPVNGKWTEWHGNAVEIDVDNFDVLDVNSQTFFNCNHAIYTVQGPYKPPRNVICISRSQGVGMGFPSFKVIHYGTDTDFYAYHESKEEWFLYFSRIVHGKGPHIAIQLAKELGFELKVVGEDKLYCEPEYVKQIKKMCEGLPNVEYVGPKYNEDAVWYLQRAKALLFPQHWSEAFGLVMIEALSCGTPVIAGGTNGAPPEVIDHGKTGFLCYSYNDFINACKRIEEINPRDCRYDAVTRWSARRMTEDYLRVYKQVIEGETW